MFEINVNKVGNLRKIGAIDSPLGHYNTWYNALEAIVFYSWVYGFFFKNGSVGRHIEIHIFEYVGQK